MFVTSLDSDQTTFLNLFWSYLYPLQTVFVSGMGINFSCRPSVIFWSLQGVSNKHCLLAISCCH